MAEPFTPRYLAAFTRLIGEEGGYVDDPKDRGGATKYGVSLRFALAEVKADRKALARFDIDMDGDVDAADIRKLSLDQAQRIYLDYFWLPNGCTRFPAPIGEMIFDQAVNGGALAARKLLQRAIAQALPLSGGIKVDGILGPVTMTNFSRAIMTLGVERLADAYRDAAKARYKEIAAADASQKRFLKGWLARADRLGRDPAQLGRA